MITVPSSNYCFSTVSAVNYLLLASFLLMRKEMRARAKARIIIGTKSGIIIIII